jgi:hypothetical protein
MSAQLSQDFPAFTPAPYNYQPLGCAQVAVTGTAQTLAQLLATAFTAGTSKISTVPTGARMVLIIVESANVRWTDDGLLMPTAAVGMLATSTQQFQYSGDLSAIEFIAVSGSPLLDLAFYK